jgi:DNA-binding transcriptional MerR regulator
MATNGTAGAGALSIDELAAATGTTTRSIRSFQTLGLLDHPDLRGRTGLYGGHHRHRLEVILGLQSKGFSLRSLSVLFAAHGRGESLGDVLGLGEAATEIDPDLEAGAGAGAGTDDAERDDAERYGFGELQQGHTSRRVRRLLAVVPTTVWDETAAS